MLSMIDRSKRPPTSKNIVGHCTLHVGNSIKYYIFIFPTYHLNMYVVLTAKYTKITKKA